MQENDEFIIKVYKEGLPQRASFRLINPSKTNIGKRCKKIIDKINLAVTSETSSSVNKTVEKDFDIAMGCSDVVDVRAFI